MRRTAKKLPVSELYKVNLIGGFREVHRKAARGQILGSGVKAGVTARANPVAVSIVEAFARGYVPENHENGGRKQALSATEFFQNLRRSKQRKITF